MPPAIDRKSDNSSEAYKPSAAVQETRLLYRALGGNEDLPTFGQVDEAAKVVTDFAKELVYSATEVAQLVPIIQELSSSDSKNRNVSWLALNNYDSKDPLTNEYLHALSLDLGVKIPTFLDHHYESKVENSIGQFDAIPIIDVLELMSDKSSSLVKDPQGVNIESSLIASSFVYTALKDIRMNPHSVSEEELSKTLFAAESFCQPLMEIIGFDGIVMAIKQEVDLIRLNRSSTGEYDGITKDKLEAANKMIDQLPDPQDMPDILNGLMSKLTLRVAESRIVLGNASGHDIQIGAGRILEQYVDDDIEDSIPVFNAVRWVWRVKSATSVARKVITHDEKTGKKIKPADIKPISDLVGVTVIVPSVDALAYYFQQAAGILQDLQPSQLALSTSRHKDTAFYAKTAKSDEMIEAIEIDLGNLGARLDKKLSDNGHKVIKVTLQYTPKDATAPVPVEVIFQTEEDRANSRTGTAAHANKRQGYKTDAVTTQATKGLGELPKRRARASQAGLTLQSIEGGNLLYPRIAPDQATQRALGASAMLDQRPLD